jgi:hypothetical protein
MTLEHMVLYPVYKVYLLCKALTLTFDLKNIRTRPLMMVIKCTKLYDAGDYGSVSILPKGFFFYYGAVIL